MNSGRLVALLALAFIGLVIGSSALYSVDERQKAIVTRFGQVVRTDDAPGFHVKTPLVDEVRYFDSRILTLDAEPQLFLTKEKKYVVVDSYVKWQIADVLKYYLTVGGNEADARRRLEQMINSGLRDEFNARNVQSVISLERRKIMELVTANTDKEARKLGIGVVDVRIQRVDLPDEVSQSVFQRMKAERSRIANELRAQGAEAAEKIRAEAERAREVLIAEAYRDGERIRGEGDARAAGLYAKAYGQAPEFAGLYQSLRAYRNSFSRKEDVMVLDPSSDFFRHMKKP